LQPIKSIRPSILLQNLEDSLLSRFGNTLEVIPKSGGFDPLIIYANEEEYLPPAAVGQSVLELYDYVDFGR